MSGPFEAAMQRAQAAGKRKPLELARVIREVFDTPEYAKREQRGESLSVQAKRIADQWEADHTSVDPEALEPKLRAAVRLELQSRREMLDTDAGTGVRLLPT